MPNLLKRDIAPLTDAAWAELDAQARDTIQGNLSARRLVDFSGPHGWELASVNLGRVKLSTKGSYEEIPWGHREVQPLIETWNTFSLDTFELDNLTRGAADADLDALEQAAGRSARFEEQVIYNGFAPMKIQGLRDASAHKAVALPADAEGYPKAVSAALKAMGAAGIGGPYAVVLGPDAYYTLAQSSKSGVPPRRIIEEMTGGSVLLSPILDGGVVLSTRGGDFELTIGQDFSLGYASHTSEAVELFIAESFTFRVLEPRAAVVLSAKK
jgi:uncharacterized linocin/CFP29 family protein